eukprot:TRINITY_DN8930_c0_g3_i1.p1 TRINITY_DN8930_c0_g3~~TRINITY_DN8930_c0_g3_i1.p1  ORF type:complete len:249 (+),score=40.66 TRINITY_DN8930_c0_g3_i1:39-749(+)
MKEYRIVVCGLPGSGRSCLTLRYTQNVFVEDFDPTVEDRYRHAAIVNGEETMLEIFDIAGAEYPPLSFVHHAYMKPAHAFVIVYSITSKRSLEEVCVLRSHALDVKGGHVPTIIVAAKCDLETERVVSREEGEALARELSCQFMESSSKEDVNVREAFELLVSELQEYPGVRRLIPHGVTQRRLCAIAWCLMEKTCLPFEIIARILQCVERPLFECEDAKGGTKRERGRGRRCAVQ